MTREELLRLAAETDGQLRAAIEAGDRARALVLQAKWQLLMELASGPALPGAEPSGNLQHMTGAQLERRGRAIAAAKSAKSKDPLWKAITASKWGSQERYARDRLRLSPASLSGYRSGTHPCPRSVADRVKADLGIDHDYWPAGVVE